MYKVTATGMTANHMVSRMRHLDIWGKDYKWSKGLFDGPYCIVPEKLEVLFSSEELQKVIPNQKINEAVFGTCRIDSITIESI